MSRDIPMTTYCLHLIPLQGAKDPVPTETVECASDAQALREACRVFGRRPEVEAIEIWDDGRKVVALGGRSWERRRW
jgi:hypothetical protein